MGSQLLVLFPAWAACGLLLARWAGGGAGLGGALGSPGLLVHFLIGPSYSLLEGTSSGAWRVWLVVACLLGWGLYLQLQV